MRIGVKPPPGRLYLATALSSSDFKRLRDGLGKLLHNQRLELVEPTAAKGLSIGKIPQADIKL